MGLEMLKKLNNDLSEALDIKINRVEADTQSIEGKVDTIDTIVDSLLTIANVINVNTAYIRGSSWNFAGISNLFTVVDQWYTVVDTTGPGMLKRIGATAYNGSGNLEIRVTVDGSAKTVADNGIQSAVMGVVTADDNNVTLFPGIVFDSTLKVEIRDRSNVEDKNAAFVEYTKY